MRRLHFWTLLFVLVSTSPALAQVQVAKPDPNAGFHDESELGVVLVSGNAQTASYNLSQLNSYGWSKNMLKLTGKLLRASSRDLETSRYWTLGLRYERELNDMFSTFAAYSAESDIFAGYNPRHNGDVGAKYYFTKRDALTWFAETGYRYTREHKISDKLDITSHFARLYSEALRQWNKTASTKLWAEYLPNFTDFRAYRINSEISALATLNDVFSTKLGYLVRFNNVPLVPGGYRADRFFTAALVAKF